MADETLQLLKAFIDAAGYDVRGEVVSVNNYDQQTRTIYKVTKKKPKPRAQAKAEGYSEEFIKLWNKYPKGHSGGKAATYRKYNARLEDNTHVDSLAMGVAKEYNEMERGLDRYIKYIEATGYSVKSSETFFGRDRHYTNPFEITEKLKKQNRVKQEWETIPKKNLIAFIEKHGFKKGDRMETEFETIKRLTAEIRARVEAEYN